MNVTLKNTPYAKLLERKRLMQIPSEKKDKNIPRHGLSVIILGLVIFIFVALYKDHIDGWLNLIYPLHYALEKLRLSLRGKNGSQLAYGMRDTARSIRLLVTS